MRKTLSRLACMAALLLFSCAASAQNARDVKGLYLLTDYPAVTVQPGTTSTIDMRLRNFGLPPARLDLQVEDVPKGWTATLLGGGQPVGAAMAATDDSVSLQLRLKVPADAGTQPHMLNVVAQGNGQRAVLPLQVMLAKELPAKLTLETPLPSIKGGARSSFDYQFTVKNDSGKDLTVSFDAKTPKFFEPSFTEGYGTQQISTLPIKAGQSKDVKLTVRPPGNAKPGDYPIEVTASAEGVRASAALQLQITGQPSLRISGRDGLMSGAAEAGKTSTLPIIVVNDGGADADAVNLSATAPSGWRIDFEPKTIPHIAAGQQVEAQARITPSARSLAGDYMATLDASAGGQNASGDFRITVSTSSLWGIAGAVIVAIAVLILVGAVARFGRR
ncbi:COG1470 family protein [Bordetella genomosp. 9]|uniref:Alpha-galactosidase NEW3 domain-containing protein n=1 Tax=Bordetella genomosp. 9 TaxID=1416803 RepID=A0A1W6YVL7_9BORD|nr:NEW3 domain-containing protein [Bordetella genomosp. 9]ARP84939.1 hypothetical protein CAL13_00895 [Bordetella genomosp. 9]